MEDRGGGEGEGEIRERDYGPTRCQDELGAGEGEEGGGGGFFLNDTATTEIYTLSLHDVFRSGLRSEK